MTLNLREALGNANASELPGRAEPPEGEYSSMPSPSQNGPVQRLIERSRWRGVIMNRAR
jgi:hypothetical protein